MVEYITAYGLFSIDLALRPPPALDQSAQPAAAAADARAHVNGSGQSSVSSVSSGSSEGSSKATSDLAAGDGPDGRQEHQVRTCGKAFQMEDHAQYLVAAITTARAHSRAAAQHAGKQFACTAVKT